MLTSAKTRLRLRSPGATVLPAVAVALAATAAAILALTGPATAGPAAAQPATGAPTGGEPVLAARRPVAAAPIGREPATAAVVSRQMAMPPSGRGEQAVPTGLTRRQPAGGVATVPPAGELAHQIEDASRRLEIVVEQYNNLRMDLANNRRRSAALDRQAAPLRRELDRRQDRVGEFAAAAYRSGAVRPVSMLLTAHRGREFMDRLLVLDRLAHQQQREITALSAVQQRYEAARLSLGTLAAQQQSQERALLAKRTQITSEIAQLEQMREQAYGAGGWAAGERTSSGDLPAPPAGAGGDVVRFALAQIGKEYRWAAEGPDAYDCSGLVTAAYRTAGISLPHNSRRQWRSVVPISRTELRPGDLIFYYPDVHHVGVYAGDNRMIHAPQYGEPVRVDPVDRLPVYGYGRVQRGG